MLLDGLRLGDLAVMFMAFGVGFALSAHRVSPGRIFEFLSIRVTLLNLLLLLGFGIAWYGIFLSQGLYRSRRMGSIVSEWSDIARAVSLGTLLLATLALVLDLSVVNRTFLVAFFATSLLATLTLRGCLRLLLGEVRRKGANLRRVVIVGCGPRGAALGQKIRTRPDLGYILSGFLDDIRPPRNPAHGREEKLLGSLSEAPEVLSSMEVDEVIIALPVKSHYEAISRIIAASEDLGVIVRMPADFFRLQVARADVDYLDEVPIVTLHTPTPSAGPLFLKRLFDLLIAATVLVLLLPLFLVIAVAIKLESRGRVLYGQKRVGLGRRTFKMWKFRTMVEHAEARQQELDSANQVAGAAFKIARDPRVTRVGKFLRKFSLDELPQLWNVVVGQMSLVGPRPLPIRDVARFDQRWQNRRFSVKPGLTCLWQANGRHEIEFDDWMELDLQYIDQWSLGLDIEILFKTVPAVLRGTGAS